MYNYLRRTGKVTSQKQLSQMLGMNQSSISQALNGVESYTTDSLLQKINYAFGNIFNKQWIETGKGEMLARTIIKNNHVNGDFLNYSKKTTSPTTEQITLELVQELRNQLHTKDEQIKDLHEILKSYAHK
ncbi:MAG: hypothetical protein IJ680_01465 [Paludibacteraceae bacterium]|nr:hypothetical protein [Paludibacteraceae bacterium]